MAPSSRISSWRPLRVGTHRAGARLRHTGRAGLGPQYKRMRLGWERAMARLKVYIEKQMKEESQG